jgi:hypothetical protein
MFADPQPVSLDNGTTTNNYARTSIDNGVGTFVAPDGLSKLIVRQTVTKTRKRHELRVTLDKLSVDPLSPSFNVPKSVSGYFVLDEPLVGFTALEKQNVFNAVRLVLNARIGQLTNGEY